MPETRRSGFAERIGAIAGATLIGTNGGGGIVPTVQRIIAGVSNGTTNTTGTSQTRFIDEDQDVTSYGPDPILAGVPGNTRWIITAYVKATSAAPAIGGLSIAVGNTAPNLVTAEKASPDAGFSGDLVLHAPAWSFYAVDQPQILAGWTGDPIDSLELHVRADRL